MPRITSRKHSFLAYTLVKEKSGCINDGGVFGGKISIAECSEECKSKAPVFVFGRSGTPSCDGLNCNCWCSTKAFPNGTCVFASKADFDTYKINKGKVLKLSLLSFSAESMKSLMNGRVLKGYDFI